MCTSVSKLIELGIFLMLRLLGSVHNDDVMAITSLLLKWSENRTLVQILKIKKWEMLSRNSFNLLRFLKRAPEEGIPCNSKIILFKAKLGQLNNVNTYQESRFVGLWVLHHWLIFPEIIMMSVIGQYKKWKRLLFQRKQSW